MMIKLFETNDAKCDERMQRRMQRRRKCGRDRPFDAFIKTRETTNIEKGAVCSEGKRREEGKIRIKFNCCKAIPEKRLNFFPPQIHYFTLSKNLFSARDSRNNDDMSR